MLQALKNLEARSPRPAGVRAPAPAVTVNEPPHKEPAPTAAAGSRASPPKVREEAVEAAPIERVRPTRRPDAPPLPAAVPAVTVPLAEVPRAPANVVVPRPVAALHRPRAEESPPAKENAPAPQSGVTTPGKTRPACNYERLTRRNLRDPARSQPLIQLAERLWRDAEQTTSKTLALVGIGEQSATHETLLYAATLLAEAAARDVLLVDADQARRALSEALEYGQEAGLAELLRGDALTHERYRPTAVARLSFLPAGLLRQADLSTAGPRLELVLQQLAAGFSVVLLDGGRASDLAATMVARQADATYLVVQLGTVETSEAQAALRDFRAAGARVLGCIAT
jgi:Mrp family chromosome partitioning ATPase